MGDARDALISSFGVDADGELYVLNYEAGAVLKIVPDSSLAPGLPEDVRTTIARDQVELTWSPPSDGAQAIAYVVETSAASGERTLRSIDAGDRLGAKLRLSSDEACIRVRAVGRSATGAPAPTVCRPF